MEIRFLVFIENYFSKFKSFVGPDTILYANPSLGAVFGNGSSVLTPLPRYQFPDWGFSLGIRRMGYGII